MTRIRARKNQKMCVQASPGFVNVRHICRAIHEERLSINSTVTVQRQEIGFEESLHDTIEGHKPCRSCPCEATLLLHRQGHFPGVDRLRSRERQLNHPGRGADARRLAPASALGHLLEVAFLPTSRLSANLFGPADAAYLPQVKLSAAKPSAQHNACPKLKPAICTEALLRAQAKPHRQGLYLDAQSCNTLVATLPRRADKTATTSSIHLDKILQLSPSVLCL